MKTDQTTFERREWRSPGGAAGVQLLTEHFDLRVTSPDEELQQYLPDFMEATYAAYTELKPPPEATGRLVTYLFADRPQWAAFTQAAFPQRAQIYLHIHSGGYTDPDTAVSVVHDIQRDRTLALLAHEGWHQYLATFGQHWTPPWLNEGMACQFESFELRGRRPVFTPRKNFLRRNSLRAATGNGGGLIELPTLLAINAGDALRNAGISTQSYYAQVWSLVLFLREGENKRYADGLDRLLADLATDAIPSVVTAAAATGQSPGEAVFRHYISDDINAISEQYSRFVRSLLH